MICDICGSGTDKRHPILMTKRERDWVCGDCFKLFKELTRYYSKKYYDQERVTRIMKSIIAKQKAEGKWQKKNSASTVRNKG